MNTKRHGSLFHKFLRMTLLPLLCLGIVLIFFCSYTYERSMQTEVEKDLRSVGISVIMMYDRLYPGDYNLVIEGEDKTLFKGETRLSQDNSIVDEIQEKTGNDVTLFFYDIRMLTTIKDEAGNRYTGYTANSRIVEKVLEHQEEAFYDNVMINRVKYYAYYIPICSEDGVCIAMLAVARPAAEVSEMVNGNIMKITVIILAALVLTSVFIAVFNKRVVAAIRSMMDFLHEMSEGNLSTQLAHNVETRTDELGEMGRFTVHVQASLRKLVERDSLTGLYNRRSGENRLNSMVKKAEISGEQYCIAIGDIDFFKKINDSYGHEAGDDVLKEVARILNDTMAGNGCAVRWGGEEFLLLFEHAQLIDARQTVQGIMDQIRANAVLSEGQSIQVTMTFGMIQGNGSQNVNTELSRADTLLYYGKEHGRDQLNVDEEVCE